MGFGGALLGNYNGIFTEAESRASVDQAWQLGIRYFDTAPGYGNGLSEYRLGQALREHDRSRATVSTKVGRVLTPTMGAPTHSSGYLEIPNFVGEYDYSYDGIMRAVEQSMQRMLTDRFDALFIHDCDVWNHGAAQPAFFRQAIDSGFAALVELREQGVVKAIGFGVNENDVMVEAVRSCDVDLCLLAGRYTLLEQEPLDDLLPLCDERGVGLILGGVYNSGILATGAIDGARFNYEPASAATLTKTSALEAVCGRYGVPLAAAAVQFAYAHPVVASICVGSRNAYQLERNTAAFDTNIPTDLWDELRSSGLIRPDAPTPVQEVVQ